MSTLHGPLVTQILTVAHMEIAHNKGPKASVTLLRDILGLPRLQLKVRLYAAKTSWKDPSKLNSFLSLGLLVFCIYKSDLAQIMFPKCGKSI